MSLVGFLQRVGGAVSGAAALLLKPRKIVLFNPDDFDVEDVPDFRISGPAVDPGEASGVTMVSSRAGAAAPVPVARTLATTAPLRIDGGASADLSANRTLTIVYSETPTASTIPSWDASKFLNADAYLGTGTIAATGFLRGGAGALLKGVDGAGHDLSVASLSSAALTLGDATRASSVTIAAKPGGSIGTLVGAAVPLLVNETEVEVFGFAMSVSGGELLGTSSKGIVKTIAPFGEASATTQKIGEQSNNLLTEDATVTPILAIDVPSNSSVAVIVRVQAISGDARAYFLYHAGAKNIGSGAVSAFLDQITAPRDTTGLGLAISVATSGSDLLIRVEGGAGDVAWFAHAQPDVFVP